MDNELLKPSSRNGRRCVRSKRYTVISSYRRVRSSAAFKKHQGDVVNVHIRRLRRYCASSAPFSAANCARGLRVCNSVSECEDGFKERRAQVQAYSDSLPELTTPVLSRLSVQFTIASPQAGKPALHLQEVFSSQQQRIEKRFRNRMRARGGASRLRYEITSPMLDALDAANLAAPETDADKDACAPYQCYSMVSPTESVEPSLVD